MDAESFTDELRYLAGAQNVRREALQRLREHVLKERQLYTGRSQVTSNIHAQGRCAALDWVLARIDKMLTEPA